MAAFWEIALHAFLLQRSSKVSKDFPIGGRDVDLYVENGEQLFLEVATVFPSPEISKARRPLDSMIQSLDELDEREYFAIVDANDGWLPADIQPETVIRGVRQELKMLRAGASADDRTLSFGPVQIRLQPGGLPIGFVGIIDEPMEWRANPEQIRSAIQKKVQKLGSVRTSGIPLVVAICDGGLSQDLHRAVDCVLFGQPAMQIIRREESAAYHPIRTTEGLFGPGGKSTRLSAVMACTRRLTAGGVNVQLHVWHNPRAATPLSIVALDPIPQTVVKTHRSTRNVLSRTRRSRGWFRLPPRVGVYNDGGRKASSAGYLSGTH